MFLTFDDFIFQVSLIRHLWLTGCAVAQHSYNGDVSFLLENGNLTPCKIKTLEQIDTQFLKIDYVHERNVCSKFGKNPFTGTSEQRGEI